MKKCHYEVLGLDKKCTEDQIKKAYRQLALIWHPDKNRDNREEASKRFIEIQDAYETLTDVNERAWYDSHRSQILRGDDQIGGDGGVGDDPSAARINIFKWFRKDCFDAFDDKPNGFFTVYRKVFEIILEEEEKYMDGTDDDINSLRESPSFGSSTSDSKDLNQFYRYWENFSSFRSFSFASKWNLNEAPNRFIRRQMETENKKSKKDAKKEFNDSVKALVGWLKKRDPRVAAFRMQKATEAKRAAEELETKRKMLEIEQKRAKDVARRQERERWLNMKKEKMVAAKERGQVFLDDDFIDSDDNCSNSDISVSSNHQSSMGKSSMSSPFKSKSKSTDRSGGVAFLCEVCRKSFKSEKQYISHEKSKKHQKAEADFLKSVEVEQEATDDNGVDEDVGGMGDVIQDLDSESSVTDGDISADGFDKEGDEGGDLEESNKRGQGNIALRDDSGYEEENDESDHDEDSSDELIQKLLKFNVKSTIDSDQESVDSSKSIECLEIPETKKEKNAKLESDQKPCRRKVRKNKSEGKKSNVQQLIEQKVPQTKANPSTGVVRAEFVCGICKLEFPTRNKMFEHIKREGHAEAKPIKIPHKQQKTKKKK